MLRWVGSPHFFLSSCVLLLHCSDDVIAIDASIYLVAALKSVSEKELPLAAAQLLLRRQLERQQAKRRQEPAPAAGAVTPPLSGLDITFATTLFSPIISRFQRLLSLLIDAVDAVVPPSATGQRVHIAVFPEGLRPLTKANRPPTVKPPAADDLGSASYHRVRDSLSPPPELLDALVVTLTPLFGDRVSWMIPPEEPDNVVDVLALRMQAAFNALVDQTLRRGRRLFVCTNDGDVCFLSHKNVIMLKAIKYAR